MDEARLYELVGRLFVDLRAAHARIEQLQQQLANATQPLTNATQPPEVPNAESQ